MQIRWKRWLLVIVVVAAALVWWASSSAAVRAHVGWLASQPDVRTAFASQGGSTDALLVLVTFALLAPMAACLLLMLIVFVVKMFELVLFKLHLPEWPSMPLVLTAAAYGTYVVREAWLPTSLYALGVVARAYLVFFSYVPSPPR
jgi:hypothetical protein